MMIIGNLCNHKYEKYGKKRIATEVTVREIHFTGNKHNSHSTEELDFNYNSEEFEEIFSDE